MMSLFILKFVRIFCQQGTLDLDTAAVIVTVRECQSVHCTQESSVGSVPADLPLL